MSDFKYRWQFFAIALGKNLTQHSPAFISMMMSVDKSNHIHTIFKWVQSECSPDEYECRTSRIGNVQYCYMVYGDELAIQLKLVHDLESTQMTDKEMTEEYTKWT